MPLAALLSPGWATTLNAEALRARFVRHTGQQTISVQRDAFVRGSASSDWAGVFAEVSEKIGEQIGEKQRELFVADFSTTGPLERAVSQLVLMDAMSAYFKYEVVSACGIPEITLLGEPDNRKRLRARATALAEYELSWWIHPPRAALDRLVAAAEGKPDVEAWRSFFKFDSVSGSSMATGWINALFPYLEKMHTRQ